MEQKGRKINLSQSNNSHGKLMIILFTNKNKMKPFFLYHGSKKAHPIQKPQLFGCYLYEILEGTITKKIGILVRNEERQGEEEVFSTSLPKEEEERDLFYPQRVDKQQHFDIEG